MNIPALVYADLTGRPRPAPARLRAGLRWCRPWKDFSAAHEAGESLASWTRWSLGCEAKSTLSLDDPLSFLRATLYRLVRDGGRREATGVWRSAQGFDA